MPEPKKQTPSESSPTTPERSPQDLYKEAKRAERKAVTAKTIDLVRARISYGDIGGRDKTEQREVLLESLLDLVQAFPQGLPLPFAKIGFDDHKLFQIREQLLADGKIKEENRGQATYLLPVIEDEDATA